jgi:hypothetical protein
MNIGLVKLQPTASCSTSEDPIRYLCRTVDGQRQHLFYTAIHDSLKDLNKPTKYYITSTWIPSFDEFVLTESVLFQPEGENEAYRLQKNVCVRAAGPTGLVKQNVTFTKINKEGKSDKKEGDIISRVLKKQNCGWYKVSNCRSELSRWWYSRDHTTGFVCSRDTMQSQAQRDYLLEERNRDMQGQFLRQNQYDQA